MFGAAIAVSQHTTQLPIKVEINGGEFAGHAAFYQANPQNNPQEALDKIELSIKGGTFYSRVGGNPIIKSDNFTKFIQGGIFFDDVSEYVVDDKCSIKKRRYEVKDCPEATNFYRSDDTSFPVVLEGTTIKLNETQAVLRKLESTPTIQKILSLTTTENLAEVKEVAGEKLLFVNMATDGKNQTKVFRAKVNEIFAANAFKAEGATKYESGTTLITPDLEHAIVPAWVNKNHPLKAYHIISKEGKEIGYTLQTAKPDYGRFFAPKNYTITFDANGGTAVAALTQGYGTTITVPTPTKSCHRFTGWEPALPATMPAENTTFKAQWVYDCGGGG